MCAAAPPLPPRGRFITLEGGEGAGKTTQIRGLAEGLREADVTAVRTREPGGSPSGERIRDILVDRDVELTPLAEAMLHNGARQEHLTRTIRPALDRGECVLCDRFADSTRVYQGFGLGVPESEVDTLERMVVGDTVPDLTLVLDVPVDVGLTRARGRRAHADRYEGMDVAFHERLRQGYLTLARRAPERCAVVDADRDADAVQAEIRRAVRERLGIAL